MKKIILYTQPNGVLAVVHPVIDSRMEMTEKQALARALQALPNEATDAQVVDESVIPADRTFRNAWKLGANGIEHDMAKAREIHRNKLRDLRTPKLVALDVAYMRADEAGDEAAKKAIAAEKQSLREVTDDPAIDDATTPEALKAVMPAALRAE